jgi:hypothetical protein
MYDHLTTISAAAKTKPKAKAKRKIPAAQLKKMQTGLRKYRAEMAKLREKAAKAAKITPRQYEAYLEALQSDECASEGRLAGVKAAEIAKISDAKYKAFTKAYREAKQAYKDEKAESRSANEDPKKAIKERVKAKMAKIAALIKTLREAFHKAKSESSRNLCRHKIDSAERDFNRLYSALHGRPYYAVASDEAAPSQAPAPETAQKEAPASSPEKSAGEAKVSSANDALLNKQHTVAEILNLIQSDEFFEWYSGPFNSWLAEEKDAPTDDKIVGEVKEGMRHGYGIYYFNAG